jgi:hypothetical protein
MTWHSAKASLQRAFLCRVPLGLAKYPKYHEYHFLDDQIPLFHAPAVQI